MMKVEIDEDGRLICPTCQASDSYLHSRKVAIMTHKSNHERNFSEAIIVSNNRVTKSESNIQLPMRGDSIVIMFYCEYCGDILKDYKYLYISQHKGCTYLSWEKEFPAVPEVVNL